MPHLNSLTPMSLLGQQALLSTFRVVPGGGEVSRSGRLLLLLCGIVEASGGGGCWDLRVFYRVLEEGLEEGLASTSVVWGSSPWWSRSQKLRGLCLKACCGPVGAILSQALSLPQPLPSQICGDLGRAQEALHVRTSHGMCVRDGGKRIT